MAKRAKVLFCATKDVHYKVFHLPYFKWFKENGLDVHTVASDQLMMPYVDQKFIIPIQRSPFHYLNFKAYKQLKEHQHPLNHVLHTIVDLNVLCKNKV